MSRVFEILDGYFARKSQSEQWMFFAFHAVAIATLCHILAYEPSTQYLNEKQSKLANAQKRLASFEQILNIQSDTLDVDTAMLLELKNKLLNLEKSINESKILKPNKNDINEFIDDIFKFAQNSKTKILNLQSAVYTQISNGFDEIFVIKLNGISEYQNMISFLNKIETHAFITKIKKLEIAPQDRVLKFSASISVWGIK